MGLLSFLVVQALMMVGIELISVNFFVFIWWSYILLVDGFLFWRTGTSLFFRLRAKILILMVLSYLFWEFFELINLRLANWRYVTTSPFRETAKIPFFKMLAFGSTLPGILETHEILKFFRLGSRFTINWERMGKFFQWAWWGRPRCLWVSVGIAMIFAVLVWPFYLFWIVWIATIFIFDPLVEKGGGHSIFCELRQGKVRTFCRLLVTGLVCGFLWEGWNYWAGLKWVYDVPFVGDLKIFEMPLLGYLGFTVFAVECYVFCQWVNCQRWLKMKA